MFGEITAVEEQLKISTISYLCVLQYKCFLLLNFDILEYLIYFTINVK